ncbi:ribosome biogenesis GTP-binding protein YihA/YsxC [Amorphus orientalis]|uniref:Probable GTP-binding protein EngB n=1 Tax=Amorphus orientalis TaxID=649198 RepID=A0AAE3VR62_9HYPH|nr:ribosome biogenesis GTP-binding protein YihA/YsxC [Amorphus orientalis]MDQ0316657.1 GTP-binding protein [Amorphus orientalis]
MDDLAHRLFARPWSFLRGARGMGDLPDAGPLEVAFAGRSNVGKSTLLNALVGQKALARTSNTPGRTQELNFFVTDTAPIVMVDMPGYGYAAAPKKTVEAWTGLVFDYLRGRVTLRRVYLLIDARHGLKANDEEVMNTLDQAAVSYQIVLTKTDKIAPSALETLLAETAEKIKKRPAAYPEIVATSSVTKEGVDALRAELARLAAEAAGAQ